MKSNFLDSTEGIFGQIGNTPLVRLNHLSTQHQVWGKMENLNPGGSIKDRTAKGILRRAIQQGQINENTTVIESTSGNMGIGLAIACQALGLTFIAVVDPYVNRENIRIMRLYGAQIHEVTQMDEYGSYLNSRIRAVEQYLATHDNTYWTAQYTNPANPQTHHTTMEEIVTQLGRWPHYLFVATSTCGTIAGMSEFCKTHGGPTQIVAVDAVGSLIFSDEPGTRRIPGFGAARKSQLINHDYIDHVSLIEEKDSIRGAYQLLGSESILAGGSTGANVTAYNQMKDRIPAFSDVVLMICDRGERYLQTLYNPDWLETHYGSSFVEELNLDHAHIAL